MKLLFIITQSELGGAQRWVFDTATHLDKNRYEVVVAGQKGPLLNKLQTNDIRCRYLKYLIREINPVKDFLALLEIYRLIKSEEPNILQLCSAKAGLLGSLAAKIYNKLSIQYLDDRQDIVSKCRIIYRIGGWTFNDPRPWWQKKIFLWLEKLTAPLKDKIIVNSRHDYEQTLRLGIADKNKLVLLYNGIDLSVVTSLTRVIASEAKQSQKLVIANSAPKRERGEAIAVDRHAPAEAGARDDILLGSIANFYPTKGLAYLIRAIALLNFKFHSPAGESNFKLIIVGDGEQRPLLEQLIKKYKLENVVKLIGQKNNPWGYFTERGGIDIFVIPSVKEGMPYVLLEAMAVGLPIIAAKVGGIPEIIENEKSGLIVPPADPEKLAEAISHLIHDRELRDQLGKNAQKRAQDFNLEGMMMKYEQIIKN